METSEISHLQSAIDLTKARTPIDLINCSKIFNDELAHLLEQGHITQEQIDEVKFPSWEKRESIGAKMREALLSN